MQTTATGAPVRAEATTTPSFLGAQRARAVASVHWFQAGNSQEPRRCEQNVATEHTSRTKFPSCFRGKILP